ncbi:MAG: hypothetical protein RIT24_3056 [Planctomycetota bacterium]|jgi:hypothetical protein
MPTKQLLKFSKHSRRSIRGQDAGLDFAWFETKTHGQNQDGLASCGISR